MIKFPGGQGGLRQFKTGLLGSAATLLVTSAMGLGLNAASAQDADTDFDMDLEEVTVTGSRIVRRDLTAPSPISTVGAEEFQLSGAQNVEQVLATLPQTIPGFGASSNNPGNGTATTDLRGLGSRRTLVLVNGRRYLQSSQNGVVDLNTIPTSLVERVEVVTGGASAVYGSDAMAGVVNFVLKDDYEGMEVSGQYDTTIHGDAEKYDLNATMGGNFAGGRGNATLFMNYAKRKPLMQGDRKFSTFALSEGGDPNKLPDEAYGAGTGLGAGGSSGIPGTRIFGGPGVDTDGDGVADYTLGRFNSDGSGAPYSAVTDPFNFAPDNFLQLPQERWLASAMAHYQINDSIRMYAEATFVSNKVPQELAPTPAFTTIEINPDSPFFTADVQAALATSRTDTNGDGVVDGDDNMIAFVGRRMVENGPRQALDTRDGMRFMIGFDGEIGNGWTYDLSYSYARVDNFQFLKNDVAASSFRQAIAVTDDGTACQDPSGGCVPLNIFGAGNISQEAVNFIKVDATNVTEIETQQLMGIVSGALGDWTGAGEVGLAIGVEYRKDESAFTPDTFLATGNVMGFNAGQPTVGGFDTYEVFAEMALPLITGAPMAENLEASLAARYADYSTAGGVWSYAGGLTWAPVADVSLRAQYQRAVRAPSVQELFQGLANGFPGATDPCSDAQTPTATLISLCEATGVPAGLTGNFTQANAQIQGLFGGNPDLQEETADTYTFGAVVTPEFLPGFTATVDYYNITIDGAVSTLGGGVNPILHICYNVLQDLNSEYCQAVTRRVDGNVDTVFAGNANIGQIKTEGVDLQWSYRTDLDWGFFEGGSSLSFNFVGTHVINSEVTPDLFVGTVLDCDGTYGNTCGNPDAKNRFNLRTTLANGPLQLSLNWRWVDKVLDEQLKNTTLTAADLTVPSIKSESYFDLSFTYDMNESLQMYGGVRNLLNNKPTFLGDQQQQANTFPNAYDTIGTRMFLGAKVRF